MLLDDGLGLSVVENPTAFPPGDYDGLVADDLPPLLHPRMLMDYVSFDAWELHAVAVCASASTVWTTLATLARDAERMRVWRPGGASLGAYLGEVQSEPPVRAAAPPIQMWVEVRVEQVVDAVPAPLRRSSLLNGIQMKTRSLAWTLALRPFGRFDHAARRFLAAHALGNWCAYQGRGLRTYVRSLEAAAAVLAATVAARTETSAGLTEAGFIAAVRDSDLLLRHLASHEELAREWSRSEE
jgi:hypothetical protein